MQTPRKKLFLIALPLLLVLGTLFFLISQLWGSLVSVKAQNQALLSDIATLRSEYLCTQGGLAPYSWKTLSFQHPQCWEPLVEPANGKELLRVSFKDYPELYILMDLTEASSTVEKISAEDPEALADIAGQGEPVTLGQNDYRVRQLTNGYSEFVSTLSGQKLTVLTPFPNDMHVLHMLSTVQVSVGQ